MAKAFKNRASKKAYLSTRPLTFVTFESPFSQKLPANNRWVQLAQNIPWDDIVEVYNRQLNNTRTGASNINPRVVIGALMVKHLLNLSDRDTILAIQENIYIQHFLGFDNIIYDAPFNPSLFVEIRKRMGMAELEKINDMIYRHSMAMTDEEINISQDKISKDKDDDTTVDGSSLSSSGSDFKESSEERQITHSGRMLVDATACPQDIAYPTDIKILNASREKSEELIDVLYDRTIHGPKKPRTYREDARIKYLFISKKKVRRRKELRKAIGQQLRYLKRNLSTIKKLLSKYPVNPLKERELAYYETIKKVFEQQDQMYSNRTHSVSNRIVSIHQSHVRPIVRGKEKAKVEFGSKINVSLVNGYGFVDHLSWDAFNEGGYLMKSVELYKKRHGFYPAEVMVDQIYGTRENRRQLKDLGIKIVGRQLGRPPKIPTMKLDPGDRNPIEGKFGQGKTRYGLGLIKARLKETSESWVASILLVMNLVRMASQAALLFFVFLIQGILGMIGSIIRQINGYWSVCRWMWNSNKFSYSR